MRDYLWNYGLQLNILPKCCWKLIAQIHQGQKHIDVYELQWMPWRDVRFICNFLLLPWRQIIPKWLNLLVGIFCIRGIYTCHYDIESVIISCCDTTTLGLFSQSGKTSYSKNITKSRSRDIEFYNDRIALIFDRHLGSGAAEVPVNFSEKFKPASRGFETSQGLAVRRPSAQWLEALAYMAYMTSIFTTTAADGPRPEPLFEAKSLFLLQIVVFYT